MDRKDPKGSVQDIFDEALELDTEDLEDLIAASTRPTIMDEIEADPTFYDEQVINVPIVENPGVEKVTSYPDTLIYDQLFSLDDEAILDEDKSDIVYVPEADYVPEEDPVPEEPPMVSAPKKTGKKPPVRRAGEKKAAPVEEAVIEEDALEEILAETSAEAEEAPLRKKPRVKRAGEQTAATSTSPAVQKPQSSAAPKRPVVKPAPVASEKPAPPKNAPAKRPVRPESRKPDPIVEEIAEEAAVVTAAAAAEEDLDDTMDLITWEESASTKVTRKKAEARKAEKLAIFDRFKKKLAGKLP